MDLTAQLLNLAPLGSDPFEHFTRFTEIGQSEQPSPPRTLQIQHRLETQQILELVSAYIAGSSVRDLSGQFKINRTTVVRHLKHHGVPRRRSQRKLTDQDVADAARLYQAGWSLTRLGEHYRVDDETVRRAFRRAGIPMRPRRGFTPS